MARRMRTHKIVTVSAAAACSEKRQKKKKKKKRQTSMIEIVSERQYGVSRNRGIAQRDTTKKLMYWRHQLYTWQ